MPTIVKAKVDADGNVAPLEPLPVTRKSKDLNFNPALGIRIPQKYFRERTKMIWF